MKRSEVAALLSMCSAYDNRTIGEADVVAWHTIIGHLPVEQARAAVIDHYTRESRRIMPADVMAGAKRIRRDLLDSADASFVPSCDPDDAEEYRRQLIEHRKAVADGHVVAVTALEGPAMSPRKVIAEIAARKAVEQ